VDEHFFCKIKHGMTHFICPFRSASLKFSMGLTKHRKEHKGAIHLKVQGFQQQGTMINLFINTRFQQQGSTRDQFT